VKFSRKARKGISYPISMILAVVIAITVTASILAYFYVLGPQATKQSTLAIVGQPTMYDVDNFNGSGQTATLVVLTLKNYGTDNIEVRELVLKVNGDIYTLKPWDEETGKFTQPQVPPGEMKDITFVAHDGTNFVQITYETGKVYDGILKTSAGQMPVKATPLGI